MIPPVWLYGRIGEGRRKRILGMTLQANPISEFPDESGVLMVSGEDFVQPEIHNPLMEWIMATGRLVLVVPPLQTGFQEIPLRWEIRYMDNPPEGGSSLAASLAVEVQYSLHGNFLTDRIRNLQFAGQTLAVGYYRPRISTGALAITVLPVWSLRTVDHPKRLQDWLTELFELSGKPHKADKNEQAALTLMPLHFSMLLYLESHQHETIDTALHSLENSPVFKIARELGKGLYEDLVKLGYIHQTRLTKSGREVLSKSPYAIYLNALQEGNP